MLFLNIFFEISIDELSSMARWPTQAPKLLRPQLDITHFFMAFVHDMQHMCSIKECEILFGSCGTKDEGISNILIQRANNNF